MVNSLDFEQAHEALAAECGVAPNLLGNCYPLNLGPFDEVCYDEQLSGTVLSFETPSSYIQQFMNDPSEELPESLVRIGSMLADFRKVMRGIGYDVFFNGDDEIRASVSKVVAPQDVVSEVRRVRAALQHYVGIWSHEVEIDDA